MQSTSRATSVVRSGLLSLLRHEQVETTLTKAVQLSRNADRAITLGKVRKALPACLLTCLAGPHIAAAQQRAPTPLISDGCLLR